MFFSPSPDVLPLQSLSLTTLPFSYSIHYTRHQTLHKMRQALKPSFVIQVGNISNSVFAMKGQTCWNGGGGGFFLECEDVGRLFDNSFPTWACLLLLLGGVRSRTLIPLFRPRSVHSGSASRDDCGLVFPDKLRVSSFPDRFPLYAWTVA